MAPEHQDMVDELLDLESGLTAWEVDFVEKLSHLPDERELTAAQEEKLRQIYEERT